VTDAVITGMANNKADDVDDFVISGTGVVIF
jgi:hypothetical protein